MVPHKITRADYITVHTDPVLSTNGKCGYYGHGCECLPVETLDAMESHEWHVTGVPMVQGDDWILDRSEPMPCPKYDTIGQFHVPFHVGDRAEIYYPDPEPNSMHGRVGKILAMHRSGTRAELLFDTGSQFVCGTLNLIRPRKQRT